MSSSIGSKPLLSEREAAAPSSGERFVFTRTGAETGGEVLAFDFFVAPRGGVPMKHLHDRQAEVFRCVRGELTVTVAGETRKLRPGEEVVLAPGTVHSLVNEGVDEVKCEVEYRPAGRNEAWFKIMSGFVWKHGRDPSVLDLAPFINDVDIYVAGPPRWLQRALFGWLLKPLAIVLGRRERMLAAASEAYGRPFAW
jgi:quercetin dioxygenase-like cupin family protein